MVCAAVMCIPSVANAETVADGQIAAIKARNEAYRAVVLDEEMGVKSFNIVDTNGDGVHELALMTDEEAYAPHALMLWDGEEVVGAGEGWAVLYNMQYCAETGYLMTLNGPEGGYYTFALRKWDGNYYDTVEFKQDCYYIAVDEDTESFYWNFPTPENKITDSEMVALDEKVSAYFPTMEMVMSSYPVTTEYLNKILPIDEEGIRTWLENKDKLFGEWIDFGGIWYYMYEDGTLATGWSHIDGTWYYFDADGVMVTGWVNDGGTWYYMNGSGAMVTGWVNVGGTWSYMYESGAMATGWINLGGTWYYLHGSGAMATGWINLGGTWYYLHGSGAMATGWINLGGTWYYLHESGAMATGWINDGGTWYYLHTSGAMAANQWIGNYYVNASGAWVN